MSKNKATTEEHPRHPSLSDALAATRVPKPSPKERPPAAAMEWNGQSGFIQTGPLSEEPGTWDDQIRNSGLDPKEVEVIGDPQVRAWQTTVDGVPTWLHYYKLTLRPRRNTQEDLTELIKAAKRRKTQPVVKTVDASFVLALGDLQLGKDDGDGAEGTVNRFMEANRQALARYRKIAKGAPVVLAHLGDCIEGFMSQNGKNSWGTSLTTTEQVRLYRRLVIEQIKMWAPAAPQITLAGVPGNHDEAARHQEFGGGDSWAVETLAAVQDSLELAGNYDHVTVLTPGRDELIMTLDASGTRLGLLHGHQVKGRFDTWLGKQSMNRAPIGDADVILMGHLHHLHIEEVGTKRWLIQAPALESESTWWRHRTGAVSTPGAVTFITADGQWSALEVL